MSRRFACVVAIALPMLLASCASAPEGMAERLRGARFVLLGEVHDNAEQHRQRAALLRALLADGRPTRVLFEQMPRANDAALKAAPRDAEALASAGGLDRAGWQWPLHKPLFEAAIEGGAEIGGANLQRDEVRAIVRDGAAGAPADVRALLADTRWSASQQATLEEQIGEGHCGVLPRSRWASLALAQRARDAVMAIALLTARPGERAVLVAGNGHVRRDIGVPHYLRAAGVPDEQIASVAFLEQGDDGDGPFDLVRRTVRAQRADPCAALRERSPPLR